jgi:anaerobic magnesium-protoporphyrin IX monomethyl ester cyclase
MLNPPFLYKYSRSQRSPAVTRSGTLYYPIWLAYATGVLEQAGYEVKLVDAPAMGHDLDDVLQTVERFRPRMVVLDTSTPSIHSDLGVASAIKKAVGDSLTVLVGTHVSALPTETLELASEIDVVARGEYEDALLELARTLDEEGDLRAVQGLSLRSNDGKIVHNPDRPFIPDLDRLPFVSQVYKRHLVIENYFYSIARYPVIAIVTGRGCPHRCIFCVYPQTMHGRGYRYRSIESVVMELEYIKAELPQVREIFFEDDTLTANRGRCRELSEQLIARGWDIPWTANSRADVDYETLRLMKRGGCRLLCVGFESGDQAVLDAIRKGTTLERMRRFVKDAKKAGILIHGCFMAGNPGETRESLRRTLEFSKQLNPDTAQFFPLMVYPGTDAYAWADAKAYLEASDYSQWLTAEGLHSSVVRSESLTSDEIVQFCDKARRSFYLRPRYVGMKLKQVVTQPSEALRTMKSLRTFLPYLFRRSPATEHSASSGTSAVARCEGEEGCSPG